MSLSEIGSLQKLAFAGEQGEVNAHEACREIAARLVDLAAVHAKMVRQLQQDHFELTTLAPRLSEPYRRTVLATRESIEQALAAAGARP